MAQIPTDTFTSNATTGAQGATLTGKTWDFTWTGPDPLDAAPAFSVVADGANYGDTEYAAVSGVAMTTNAAGHAAGTFNVVIPGGSPVATTYTIACHGVTAVAGDEVVGTTGDSTFAITSGGAPRIIIIT